MPHIISTYTTVFHLMKQFNVQRSTFNVNALGASAMNYQLLAPLSSHVPLFCSSLFTIYYSPFLMFKQPLSSKHHRHILLVAGRDDLKIAF